MAGRVFKEITGFFGLLRHAPPERSHVLGSRDIARRLRRAIGMSCSGAYSCGGNSNIDGLLGKELADGLHKRR